MSLKAPSDSEKSHASGLKTPSRKLHVWPWSVERPILARHHLPCSITWRYKMPPILRIPFDLPGKGASWLMGLLPPRMLNPVQRSPEPLIFPIPTATRPSLSVPPNPPPSPQDV